MDIILLPGLGCDQRLFAHQIETLSDKLTPKVVICNTHDNLNGHIDSVLEQAPEKFILIGHSIGGWIAQWLAIKAPERVSKLILIGAGTGLLTPSLRSLFENMLDHFQNDKTMTFLDKMRSALVHESRINDTSLMNLIEDMQVSSSKQGLINQITSILTDRDATPQLKAIQCNTLILHGKQDNFYREDVELLKKHVPKNHFVEIDCCGHVPSIERPEAVSALIELWLSM